MPLDPNKYLAMSKPILDPNKYRSMVDKTQIVEQPQVDINKRPDSRIFNATEVFDKLRNYGTDKIATGRLPEFLKKPAAIATSLVQEPIRFIGESLAQPEGLVGGIANSMLRLKPSMASKLPVKEPTKGIETKINPYVKITPKAEKGLKTPPMRPVSAEIEQVETNLPKLTREEKIKIAKDTYPDEVFTKLEELAKEYQSSTGRIRMNIGKEMSEIGHFMKGTGSFAPNTSKQPVSKFSGLRRDLESELGKIDSNSNPRILAQSTGQPVIPPNVPTVSLPLNSTDDVVSTAQSTGQPVIPPNVPTVSLPLNSTDDVVSTVKPKTNAYDLANLPKSTAASLDVSFHGRQGLWMIGRKEWWQAWKPTIKSLFSEEATIAAKQDIVNNPYFKEAVDNGVSLTDFSQEALSKFKFPDTTIKRISSLEEQFASKLANKIPGVKQSSKAYTTAGNFIRMKTYESMAKGAEKQAVNGMVETFNPLTGKATQTSIAEVKKNIGAYINTGTGRGSMGLRIGESSQRAEDAAELLNTVFWSPRFLASRAQLLNPLSYTKLDPFTRKEALKDATSVVVAGLSGIGVAKAAGAEVELDPTSSDFLKAKFGKVRVDMSGGFVPLVRFIAQSIDGIGNISDEDAKGPDILRFLRSKLSPAASLFIDQISGKDYLGKNVSSLNERGANLGSKFLPMVIQDFIEIYQENPELLGLAGAGLIGGSVQSYDDNKKNKGSSTSSMPKVELPSFPSMSTR